MLTKAAMGILHPRPRTQTNPLQSPTHSASGVLPFPRLLPAVVSGVALWLCYFPANLTWLAWIALVPFLTLIRARVAPFAGYQDGASSRAGRLRRWLLQPNQRLLFCAWVCGLIFFVIALKWMRVADPTMRLAWIGLATYCSFFFPITIFTARKLEQRAGVPLIVTVPALWTALEFFRAHFGGGFPWYFLSHTQHSFLPLIQVCDVTGAYGVSFLVAAVNVVVFEFLAAQKWFCRRLDLSGPPCGLGFRISLAAAVLALVAGDLGYGAWRISQSDPATGPRVALIQGNLAQDVKDHGTKQEILAHYYSLLRLALRQEPRPDLVVWPETSFPYWWAEPEFGKAIEDPKLAASLPTFYASRWNARLLSICSKANVPMLIGINAEIEDADSGHRRLYNSAVLLAPGRRALVDGYAIHAADFPGPTGEAHLLPYDPSRALGAAEAMPVHKGDTVPSGADAVIIASRRSVVRKDQLCFDDRGSTDDSMPALSGENLIRYEGRYDKIHRVPLGEFVPFKNWFPWLQKLTPYKQDYGVVAGENFTRFSFPDREDKTYRFGVLICYEDSDPYLARQYADPKDQPVDFLLNISNDAWFKGTEEHEQHLAVCRFRAIECRRAVARSVNGGITAVIDADGRVLNAEKWTSKEASRASGDDTQDKLPLPVERWSDFKSASGVLTARIPIDSRSSLYARWGDWFPWSCWGVIGAAVVWSIRRPRRNVSAGTA